MNAPNDPSEAGDDVDVFPNGVDGARGTYLASRLTVCDVARLARGIPVERELYEELQARHLADAHSLGLSFSHDPQDLGQAGWGVLFACDTGDDVREALAPLLDWRHQQAGERYREYRFADGVRPDDSARAWLGRKPRNKAPGQAEPAIVPYYLLLVGDPHAISFRFQHELDVNYAVGRIHFDSLEEYHRYAIGVVTAEKNGPRHQHQAIFFGTRNLGDRATQLSADQLVKPLAQRFTELNLPRWDVQAVVAHQATKRYLADLLVHGAPPSILFTASHGMGFPNGHPLQPAHQGALLCQDWPGPLLHSSPIPADFYFAADDLTDRADASGMIAFHFACYGAGTPMWNDYLREGSPRAQIAARPFMSRLPQRLLSLPLGSALAVVAHVERTWSHSFMLPPAGPDLSVFSSMLHALMAGTRLGHAMDSFGQKHAALAVDLNGEREHNQNEVQLATLWTAERDTRSFVVLGDPAVRIN